MEGESRSHCTLCLVELVGAEGLGPDLQTQRSSCKDEILA